MLATFESLLVATSHWLVVAKFAMPTTIWTIGMASSLGELLKIIGHTVPPMASSFERELGVFKSF